MCERAAPRTSGLQCGMRSYLSFALIVTLYVGGACASFSEVFSISNGNDEKGGFACRPFGEKLYCLGGTSMMFKSMNLTNELLTWETESKLSFPRVYHSLVCFGPQMIALGGTHAQYGIPMDNLFLYNIFEQTIDGLCQSWLVDTLCLVWRVM